MPSPSMIIKAYRELGRSALLDFAVYRLKKRSGWFRLRLQPPEGPFPRRLEPLAFTLPQNAARPTAQAEPEAIEELLRGEVQLFGALPTVLDFSVPGPLHYWTAHEVSRIGDRDIKFIWEPSRFCWVADVIRAFRDTDDPRLPSFFTAQLADFLNENPPYIGPNWASGQEVALRLMHLVLAFGSFQHVMPDFGEILAVHAARIPATMAYARAQNNNHLLSEAAGLFTAGRMLRGWADADMWMAAGWETFQEGVLAQFSASGTYMQQSNNYHRLALQLALWVRAVAGESGLEFSGEVQERLAAATRHLLAVCDPRTGAVPNLGPNDGAYLFPLTGQPFNDFRPVLQAAARAFCGAPAFAAGPWDDLGAWFAMPEAAEPVPALPQEKAGGCIRHPVVDSRACLRAAAYTHRPGHADQLHVDIFRQGIYLARDPGTYLYNGDPPWDNPLVAARYHNTLTVDGRDQMTRAGRFLYLDRAQARVLQVSEDRMVAEHDGYRALGVTHRRAISALAAGWLVEDEVIGQPAVRRTIRLHWLLPDGDWQLEGTTLVFRSVAVDADLSVRIPEGASARVGVARAGAALAGAPAKVTDGWFSPTYAVREPALSFSIEFEAELPVKIESRWIFPKAN